MKKSTFLLTLCLTVLITYQSSAQGADNFSAYYKKLSEIKWDKKTGFDYPKTLSQIDEAFKAVKEPKIEGGIDMAILRAKEAKNDAKFAEYTKMKAQILAKVDPSYVTKIMSLIKDKKGYASFVDFIKAKGYPSYNKTSTLSWTGYQKIVSYILDNERNEGTVVRIPKDFLDNALKNGEIIPFIYAQIIDWQNIAQKKDPYFYVFTQLKESSMMMEVIIRRQDAYIFNYLRYLD